MCIVCWADDSHEMLSLIFSDEKKIKMSSAAVVICTLRIVEDNILTFLWFFGEKYIKK